MTDRAALRLFDGVRSSPTVRTVLLAAASARLSGVSASEQSAHGRSQRGSATADRIFDVRRPEGRVGIFALFVDANDDAWLSVRQSHNNTRAADKRPVAVRVRHAQQSSTHALRMASTNAPERLIHG